MNRYETRLGKLNVKKRGRTLLGKSATLEKGGEEERHTMGGTVVIDLRTTQRKRRENLAIPPDPIIAERAATVKQNPS
jgi:hypothetical protein